MASILAIDPGCTESAWVLYGGGQNIISFGKAPNDEVLSFFYLWRGSDACVIEKIASYGMAVGQEVFETVYWSGRFAQAYGPDRVVRVPRLQIKLHHCHDSRAKDASIRQAIVDRFGGKERAIGRKSSPGPLFGIAGDCWAALAVALWYWDNNRKTLEAA